MKKILYAVANKKWEDFFRTKIPKEFCICDEAATYREAVVDMVQRVQADILLIREKLPGQIPITDVIHEVREKAENCRIIFLSEPKPVGDVLLATLVSYGVYDIITDQRISVDSILRVLKHPKTYKDVSAYGAEIALTPTEKGYAFKTKVIKENADKIVDEKKITDENTDVKIMDQPAIESTLYDAKEKAQSKVVPFVQNLPRSNSSIDKNLNKLKRQIDINDLKGAIDKSVDLKSLIEKENEKKQAKFEEEFQVLTFESETNKVEPVSEPELEALFLDDLFALDEEATAWEGIAADEGETDENTITENESMEIKKPDKPKKDKPQENHKPDLPPTVKPVKPVKLVQAIKPIEPIKPIQPIKPSKIQTVQPIKKLETTDNEDTKVKKETTLLIEENRPEIIVFMRLNAYTNRTTAFNVAAHYVQSGKKVLFINTLVDSIYDVLFPEKKIDRLSEIYQQKLEYRITSEKDLPKLLHTQELNEFDLVIIDSFVSETIANSMLCSDRAYLVMDQNKLVVTRRLADYPHLFKKVDAILIEQYTNGLLSYKSVQKMTSNTNVFRVYDTDIMNYNAADSGIPGMCKKNNDDAKQAYRDILPLFATEQESEINMEV